MELPREEILIQRSAPSVWSETARQFAAKQGVSINAKRVYTFAEIRTILKI